jgi:hypothetical protein
MPFWKRKPVTHALALWILVGLAGAALLGLLAWLSLLKDLRTGGPRVFPPRAAPLQEALPSLFGKVCSVSADGRLTVVSKQEYDAVLVDDGTVISAIGGAALRLSDIHVGAVITATGKDLGDRTLAAAAVTIVSKDDGKAFGECPDGSDSGAAAESWFDQWKAQPVLYAWSASSSPGEPVVAVREYDLQPPAASYELYGPDGRIAERLELKVEGLVRRKPGNPYMMPEEAERLLRERGFTAAADLVPMTAEGAAFKTASGAEAKLQLTIDETDGSRALLVEYDGKRVVALSGRQLASMRDWSEMLASSVYWISPSKRYVLATFFTNESEGPRAGLRSVHVVDLKKLGIE